MRRLNLSARPRHERGATMVFIALSMTLILGGVGLGVDTTNLRFEKSKFQHAADAAALGVGNDCVTNGCTGYQSTANILTGANSDASSPTVSLSPAVPNSTSATVTVTRAVSTLFFKALGINTKTVTAVATATWTKNPTGGPVIPFAVSMCEYARNAVNTATLISSDLNVVMDGIIKNANTTDTKAYSDMAPYLAPACNVPSDVTLPGSPSSVTMLKGGLWLSDGGNSLANGKLLSTLILQSLTSVTGHNQDGYKIGGYLTPGMTLMLAVYAPSSNYQHAGLKVTGGKVDPGPQFDMRLVGYTPFLLTGWCLQKNNSSCEVSGGVVPGSPGLAGKFVSSTIQPPKLDPSDSDFTYGDNGTDFRAVKVELVQ